MDGTGRYDCLKAAAIYTDMAMRADPGILHAWHFDAIGVRLTSRKDDRQVHMQCTWEALERAVSGTLILQSFVDRNAEQLER